MMPPPRRRALFIGSGRYWASRACRSAHPSMARRIADRMHQRHRGRQPGLGTSTELSDLFHKPAGCRRASSIQMVVPRVVEKLFRGLSLRNSLLPCVDCRYEVAGHRRDANRMCGATGRKICSPESQAPCERDNPQKRQPNGRSPFGSNLCRLNRVCASCRKLFTGKHRVIHRLVHDIGKLDTTRMSTNTVGIFSAMASPVCGAVSAEPQKPESGA